MALFCSSTSVNLSKMLENIRYQYFFNKVISKKNMGASVVLKAAHPSLLMEELRDMVFGDMS